MSANPSSNSSTAFRDAVNDQHHMKRLGENGCPEYTDLGLRSTILSLSQLVRGGDPKSLVNDVLTTGNSDDVADLFVLLFATRNTRGGKGEKKLAYDMFLEIYLKYPETGNVLIRLFPHYGYWKDMLLILHQAKTSERFAKAEYYERLYKAILDVIHAQLREDVAVMELYEAKLNETMDEDELDKLKSSGPRLSLLAKWLPREGKELDKKIGFVNRFAPLVFPRTVTELSGVQSKGSSSSWESSTKAKYRKTLVKLTSYMDLPEVLLASQRDDEIRFEKVTSRAAMRLRKTFLNEEVKDARQRSQNPKRIRLAERFMEFVVNKGLKGAQLMPHEIVQKILSNRNISTSEELVLDAQWKALWKNVVEQTKAKAEEEGDTDFNPTRMVPLSDVSGSMYGTPMEVAIALGIGISEITHDAFKNMVLTFESNPRWHRLNPGDSIVKKVRSLSSAPWGGSTNFEKAYDLILDVVVNAKLRREDMPSLIVFSDMQFNEAANCSSGLGTMHDHIRRKVAKVAKKLRWTDVEPTPLVYWNVRNTGGHPVDKETEGAVLLSGFSPSLLKLIMHGEALREEEVEVVQADGTTVTEKIRVTPEQIVRKMLDESIYDPVREILIQSREGQLREYEIPLSGPLSSEPDV